MWGRNKIQKICKFCTNRIGRMKEFKVSLTKIFDSLIIVASTWKAVENNVVHHATLLWCSDVNFASADLCTQVLCIFPAVSVKLYLSVLHSYPTCRAIGTYSVMLRATWQQTCKSRLHIEFWCIMLNIFDISTFKRTHWQFWCRFFKRKYLISYSKNVNKS